MKKVVINNRIGYWTKEHLQNGYELSGEFGFHIELDKNIYYYSFNNCEVNGFSPKNINELGNILN